MSAERFAVPSTGTPGVWHAVENRDGILVCDCIAFSFSKAPKSCRHTETVARSNRLLQRCAELHGMAHAGHLCQQCLVTLLAQSAAKVAREFVPKAVAKEKVAAARKKRVRKKKGATGG